MLIDRRGHVIDQRVKLELRPILERGEMPAVHGIIVHQTDAPTAASSLNAYKTRPIGAHFLIDKDGTIYQTASVTKRVSHVGRLKARCVAEHSCAPGEAARLHGLSTMLTNRAENLKTVPARYPSNADSIGIELVGASSPGATPHSDRIYEAVTVAQNSSLVWLVDGLTQTLGISRTEIFRHPTASHKTPSEASTARW
jgi:N-acetyl-anhydromuramyl-L-alanine amidase AmpD